MYSLISPIGLSHAMGLGLLLCNQPVSRTWKISFGSRSQQLSKIQFFEERR